MALQCLKLIEKIGNIFVALPVVYAGPGLFLVRTSGPARTSGPTKKNCWSGLFLALSRKRIAGLVCSWRAIEKKLLVWSGLVRTSGPADQNRPKRTSGQQIYNT